MALHLTRRERITGITASFLVGAAFMFDAMQALLNAVLIGLVLNLLVDVAAWMTFYLWSRLLDVSYLEAGMQKIAVMGSAMIVELVPLLNTVPAWTLAVAALVLIVKREDARYNEKHGL